MNSPCSAWGYFYISYLQNTSHGEHHLQITFTKIRTRAYSICKSCPKNTYHGLYIMQIPPLPPKKKDYLQISVKHLPGCATSVYHLHKIGTRVSIICVSPSHHTSHMYSICTLLKQNTCYDVQQWDTIDSYNFRYIWKSSTT